MSLLADSAIDEIYDAAIDTRLYLGGNREATLAGIDPGFLGLLPLMGNHNAQLMTDLNRLNEVERLADGTVPLVRWLVNAGRLTRALPQSAVFRRQLDQLGRKVTNEPEPPPPKDLPETKEAIIFQDDIIPYPFLQQGNLAGQSVAHLSVPRYDNGHRATTPAGAPVYYNGTGWLLTQGLAITNHHVVNARNQGEAPAGKADLERQSGEVEVRFDYIDENLRGDAVLSASLCAVNADLDYAIVRLAAVSKRAALRRRPERIQKKTEDAYVPVNIIQHPDGGPKRVAIRNNLVTSATEKDLRYFTDTRFGSSGSPVFDDQWQVAALHRGTSAVENVRYQGKTTAYVNIGTQMTAIEGDLQANWPGVWAEIAGG